MCDQLVPFKNWVVTYPRDKVPLNPYTGHKADVTDPETWGHFDTANLRVEANKHLLLGFVLTNSPFSCVDLDTYKTSDTGIKDYHRQLYEYFSTYSELSPNHGVHLWCVGKLSIDGKRFPQFVEVYSSKRYITITRNPINGFNRIENRQQQLEALINNYQQPCGQQIVQSGSQPEVLSDDEVCTMAANAHNGDLFKALYVGDWYGRYPSQSEADQALCNIIAFYTDNVPQVGRIFHNSELGKRRKAHRQDYLYDTKYGIVTNAFDQKLPPPIDPATLQAEFDQLKASGTTNGTTPKPSQHPPIQILPVTNPPEPIKSSEPFPDFGKPPGLVGEVAEYIYNSAPYPNEYVAIAGAIAFLAGIVGRAYNTPTHTGLNQNVVLLALSGMGKDAAHSGISQLWARVQADVPQLKDYLGPGHIASAQALMKRLSQTPSIFSDKGEVGIWLQKLNAINAKPWDAELRGLLLDLFNKSGTGQVLGGASYADWTKNIPLVYSPTFSFFGESTPDLFYKAVGENNITDGLISRLTVFQCPIKRPAYNPDAHEYGPGHDLVLGLQQLAKYVISMNTQSNESRMCKCCDETPDATAFRLEYETYCQDRLWEDQTKLVNQIYSRAPIRLLRIGSLLAVGKNPEFPVVELAHYQWTRNVIEHGINALKQRFESGEVGKMPLNFEQRQLVGECIRDYLQLVWTQDFQDSYLITQDMHDNWRIITRSYLHKRVIKRRPFAHEPHDAGKALTAAFHSYVDAGALEKVDIRQFVKNARGAEAYQIVKPENLK